METMDGDPEKVKVRKVVGLMDLLMTLACCTHIIVFTLYPLMIVEEETIQKRIQAEIDLLNGTEYTTTTTTIGPLPFVLLPAAEGPLSPPKDKTKLYTMKSVIGYFVFIAMIPISAATALVIAATTKFGERWLTLLESCWMTCSIFTIDLAGITLLLAMHLLEKEGEAGVNTWAWITLLYLIFRVALTVVIWRQDFGINLTFADLRDAFCSTEKDDFESDSESYELPSRCSCRMQPELLANMQQMADFRGAELSETSCQCLASRAI